MNLHRTLLSLVAVLLAVCFTGGRCYAESRPVVSYPTIVCTSDFGWGFYVAIRQDKPAPFPAAPDRAAHEHRDAVILPKFPVAMAYHPQPAHC